jgi:aldehyde dehydrogenase family 7 protein A1
LTYKDFPFLKELGLEEMNAGCYRAGQWVGSGPVVTSINPHTNKPIASVRTASLQEYQECITAMATEKAKWVVTPAPVRGEIVRQIGEALRAKKDALGALLTLEMGKIRSEGLGEV